MTFGPDAFKCRATDCNQGAVRYVVIGEKDVVPLCDSHFGSYVTNLEKKIGKSYREISLSEVRVFNIMKS